MSLTRNKQIEIMVVQSRNDVNNLHPKSLHECSKTMKEKSTKNAVSYIPQNHYKRLNDN